jgi:sugar phosphate isomerase/epimerase
MRSRFAVSTFCLNDHPLAEALDRLAGITDRVEVMDEGCHRLKDATVLESFNLHYVIHAPSRGVNLASLLEPVRKASVEVSTDCFRIAAEVGADVVVHPGYFAWPQERKSAEKMFRRSLRELLDTAEELSIRFFVENMGDWEHFLLKTPQELPLIDGAEFALDVGHAHQNHVLPDFLDHTISHFHLHDNDGTTDSHSTIGEGTIDFRMVMEAVQRSGVRPVIEVGTWDGVLRSIERLDNL